MEAKLWRLLLSLILIVAVLIIGLDVWQVRHGEASLLRLLWRFGRATRRESDVRSLSARKPAGARLAIIIDDLGYRQDLFKEIKELRRPFTLAVLPDLPVSTQIAAEAPALGMEVLLHLPMEPYRFPEVDPGAGALLMSMAPEELAQRTRRYLAQLPAAVGVNSHMGSKLTEHRDRMRPVMTVLAEKRLLFVDSLTSNMSVAYQEAKALGVRAARRQIFLDPEFNESSERRQFEAVTRRSEQGKDTIAIGHGHPLTLRLLREYLPKWSSKGIRIVPVSQLTH